MLSVSVDALALEYVFHFVTAKPSLIPYPEKSRPILFSTYRIFFYHFTQQDRGMACKRENEIL